MASPIKPSRTSMLHKEMGIPADEPVSIGALMTKKSKNSKEKTDK